MIQAFVLTFTRWAQRRAGLWSRLPGRPSTCAYSPSPAGAGEEVGLHQALPCTACFSQRRQATAAAGRLAKSFQRTSWSGTPSRAARDGCSPARWQPRQLRRRMLTRSLPCSPPAPFGKSRWENARAIAELDFQKIARFYYRNAAKKITLHTAEDQGTVTETNYTRRDAFATAGVIDWRPPPWPGAPWSSWGRCTA